MERLKEKADGFVFNPDRPYIENLDELPFPARHLWDLDAIRKHEDMFYLSRPEAALHGATSAAAVRMFGRKYRMRSIQNVVDELEFLHNTYNGENFTFCDDAFTVDMQEPNSYAKKSKSVT